MSHDLQLAIASWWQVVLGEGDVLILENFNNQNV